VNAGRSNELLENGGSLHLSIAWAKQILRYHLCWTKRKATTDRKLNEEEKVKAATEHEKLELTCLDYHPALVIEFDETLAPYCPTNPFTYAPVGMFVGTYCINHSRGKEGSIGWSK